ncbi:T-cell surface glycoprotein CD8 alpha chain [Dissostichus eleginoides]|uniref:T-cell surface glycoprotein CD8 alpha chain n=1 Tax=Dissostichus eleginoides TaxID=100907 RepID=A0AAD9BTG3_DISEL|nr:T-cell surface glycoprotein CD8 alpha chain [Dissostichus eleginoides]
MAAHTLRIILLIVHLPLVGGLAVDTILGDRVQFPETEQCRERGATLQHTLTGGSSQTVAHLEDVWKPEAGYKDRMSPNESVVLNRSNINDQGLYGLTCGSEQEKPIHLNVITSSEKSVTEGQAAGFTSTTLLQENSGDGDLTLTLQAVKPEDRGDYFLYVLKDRKRGHLQAVRMRVSPALNTPEERNPEQITCTPQPPCKERTPWIPIAIIAALVLVALGVVCRQRICRSNVSSGGGRSPTEEESQPITEPRVPEENGHASLA